MDERSDGSVGYSLVNNLHAQRLHVLLKWTMWNRTGAQRCTINREHHQLYLWINSITTWHKELFCLHAEMSKQGKWLKKENDNNSQSNRGAAQQSQSGKQVLSLLLTLLYSPHSKSFSFSSWSKWWKQPIKWTVLVLLYLLGFEYSAVLVPPGIGGRGSTRRRLYLII